MKLMVIFQKILIVYEKNTGFQSHKAIYSNTNCWNITDFTCGTSYRGLNNYSESFIEVLGYVACIFISHRLRIGASERC